MSTMLIAARIERETLRVYLRVALRISVISVLIVVVMTPIPLIVHTPIATALTVAAVIVVWGIVFLLLMRWQVLRIERSAHPQAQMVEAIAVIFVLFLAVFAKLYHVMSVANPESFNENLNAFTSYYLSLTVLSTVGFGDVAPTSVIARSVTMVQMVFDLVLIGFALRVLTGSADRALESQRLEATKEREV